MKIKLFYIIDGLRSGGKERQLVEIIRSLKNDECFNIGVITFNTNCHYTEDVKKYVDYFIELQKRPTRLEPLFTIRKHIKAFKPDLIHTWDTLSSFYSYWHCNNLKIKFIDGSIRDAGIEYGWQFHYKRFFLKKADLVIANSFEGLKRYNVKGEVLYNVVNRNRFKSYENNDLFNIVMTANFTGYKDHKTFINASIKLVKENIVDNVYLIGDGKYKEYYQNYIQPEIKERFIFTGEIANVEDYLAKCKVGVLCSTEKYQEGISNSVLEYMAAGLITVVTNTGGTKEIICDGNNGFLFKTGDTKSLYEKIKYIRNNYNSLVGIKVNALDTIENKFNYNNNIKILHRLYINLLNTN